MPKGPFCYRRNRLRTVEISVVDPSRPGGRLPIKDHIPIDRERSGYDGGDRHQNDWMDSGRIAQYQEASHNEAQGAAEEEAYYQPYA